MDKRIKRTRQQIINSFLELRSKKVLEKITVKELCKKANINKSTFYKHYSDIYELSEVLEKEIVELVFNTLSHPEYIFTNPKIFTNELYLGYLSQNSMIQILFSGNRSEHLIQYMRQYLKEKIYNIFPEYRNNLTIGFLFDYVIYGGYYAYHNYLGHDPIDVTEILGDISQILSNNFLKFY